MSAERRIVRVEGHEAFKAQVEEWSKEKKGNLFVYFSGSKDPETGNSLFKQFVTLFFSVCEMSSGDLSQSLIFG